MTDLSHDEEKNSKPRLDKNIISVSSRSSIISFAPYPLIILTFLVGIFIGDSLDLQQSWSALITGPSQDDSAQVIMWWIRIPQLLTALFAGAVLSISGAAMQQLLRNDLADPYLLGIASGGGLGAALALSLGIVDQYGMWVLPTSSFCGALLSSLWLEILAWRQSRHYAISILRNPLHLVLSGVALNLFLSSLLTLTLALSDEQLAGVWRWLIGHISVLSWSALVLLIFGSSIGCLLLLSQARSLTLLEAGEEVAWTLGVNVTRTRTITLLAVSLGVGTIVSFCGIIGFVGLLIPHFIRPRITGKSHQLFILALLYGAWVLLVCHLLTLLITPSVPIGVLTGVLGGFIFLLTLNSPKT